VEVEFDSFIEDLVSTGVLVSEGWDDHGVRFDIDLVKHCKVVLLKSDGHYIHPEDGMIGAPYIKDNRHLHRVRKMCRQHLAEVKQMYDRMATNPHDYPSPPPPTAADMLPSPSPQPMPEPSPVGIVPSPSPAHHGTNSDEKDVLDGATIPRPRFPRVVYVRPQHRHAEHPNDEVMVA